MQSAVGKIQSCSLRSMQISCCRTGVMHGKVIRQSGNEEGAAWGCSCTEWPSGETIPTQKVVTELWNWPHPASLNQQGVKEKFKRNARIQYSLMLHKKLFKNTVELKFQTAGSWNSNSNKPFNFHCSQLSFLTASNTLVSTAPKS